MRTNEEHIWPIPRLMHLPPEPPLMPNVIAHSPRYPLFSKAGMVEYQLVNPDPSLPRARARRQEIVNLRLYYGDSLLTRVTD
jgi:hypothetical protein